jgi:hypothetical protein
MRIISSRVKGRVGGWVTMGFFNLRAGVVGNPATFLGETEEGPQPLQLFQSRNIAVGPRGAELPEPRQIELPQKPQALPRSEVRKLPQQHAVLGDGRFPQLAGLGIGQELLAGLLERDQILCPGSLALVLPFQDDPFGLLPVVGLQRLPNALAAQPAVHPDGATAAAVLAAFLTMWAISAVAPVDGQHRRKNLLKPARIVPRPARALSTG